MTRKTEIEIILVGNELLNGLRRDAHATFVGRRLASIGVRLSGAHIVGDDRTKIAGVVRERLDKTSVLIISGGLGPTHDDITREGVAEALGLALDFDDNEWQTVKAIFANVGKEADPSNRRQAYFPTGAKPIANPRGTAAGFSIEHEGCLVVVLPGPPNELNPMMDTSVLPIIRERFQRPPLLTRTFRTTGIGESSMTPLVQPTFDAHPEFEIASLPHIGGVDIVITQREQVGQTAFDKSAKKFQDQLTNVLGPKLYATGDASLESVIGARLVEQHSSLAVAESLTGGLIGKRITDVPGSSDYFLADVVAYSNDAKTSYLDVKDDTLQRFGAVSEEVCREMAAGVRRGTGATYGLATTGIAGPDGGSEEKPVGLCYYGLSWNGGERIIKRVFGGNRDDIRERVTYASLYLLHKQLQGA